jgi:hypothetical protein
MAQSTLDVMARYPPLSAYLCACAESGMAQAARGPGPAALPARPGGGPVGLPGAAAAPQLLRGRSGAAARTRSVRVHRRSHLAAGALQPPAT